MGREERLNRAIQHELEVMGVRTIHVTARDPYNAINFRLKEDAFEMLYAYNAGDARPHNFGDATGLRK